MSGRILMSRRNHQHRRSRPSETLEHPSQNRFPTNLEMRLRPAHARALPACKNCQGHIRKCGHPRSLFDSLTTCMSAHTLPLLMAFQCTLVTPEQQVLDEKVTQVILPAHDGKIGILTDRAPLLVKLGAGALRLDLAVGQKRFLNIEGGIAQMKDNR